MLTYGADGACDAMPGTAAVAAAVAAAWLYIILTTDGGLTLYTCHNTIVCYTVLVYCTCLHVKARTERRNWIELNWYGLVSDERTNR